MLEADFGAGVNVYRGPDGRAWIDADNERMPWREVWRRGLIKVNAA